MRVEVERRTRAENIQRSTFNFRMKNSAFNLERWALNVGRLLLLTALALLESVAAPKPEASNVITVLCLGDSLTAGYGLSRSEAYPALLSRQMEGATSRCDLINA